MQQFELSASTQLERLREEATSVLNRKDEEIRSKCAEVDALSRELLAHRAEIDRLGQENGVLKQGIRIQSGMVERAKHEQSEQRTAMGQAANQAVEHIQRLERENFMLRTILHQKDTPSSASPGTPRWGEGF